MLESILTVVGAVATAAVSVVGAIGSVSNAQKTIHDVKQNKK